LAPEGPQGLRNDTLIKDAYELGNVSGSFARKYEGLEKTFRRLAKEDRAVYLPNPRPRGPADFIFIAMEPSLGAKSAEERKIRVLASASIARADEEDAIALTDLNPQPHAIYDKGLWAPARHSSCPAYLRRIPGDPHGTSCPTLRIEVRIAEHRGQIASPRPETLACRGAEAGLVESEKSAATAVVQSFEGPRRAQAGFRSGLDEDPGAEKGWAPIAERGAGVTMEIVNRS
jgi:hypothetical protein